VTLKVDEFGFYLYWTNLNQVIQRCRNLTVGLAGKSTVTVSCQSGMIVAMDVYVNMVLFLVAKQDVELIDIATVRDTRTGKAAKMPRDPKMRQSINYGSQDSLEDKALTVVSGPDFVNLTFTNFCTEKKDTAKVAFRRGQVQLYETLLVFVWCWLKGFT
jgi:stalled ribosome rescue protein Dom34